MRNQIDHLVAERHVEFDMRMSRHEVRQQSSRVRKSEGYRRAQADGAAQAGRLLEQVSLRSRGIFRHARSALQRSAASVCQRHAARGAVQQTGVQAPFETRDGFRGGGRRQLQILGRVRE